MEPLFLSALTLTEFFDHFQFSSQLGEGYPPAFNDYAQFLVYVRLPQSHPTLSDAEYRQYQNELKIKTIKELKAYWSYTREDAFLKVIDDLLKVKFGFHSTITYDSADDGNLPSIPKINIHIPDTRACWIRLMEVTYYYADYVPSVDEVLALTTQNFIYVLHTYFNTLAATQVTALTYAIAKHRYASWCSMARLYETRIIIENENYIRGDKCPSIM